ncbi:2-oxoacid:acceptor oxidoreductase subunit alpha [Patescibacteria group bacterium]|nr:2-oxoacid:acceptor oxidoreductase subunit alpha [Patescibacteria group bacterium]
MEKIILIGGKAGQGSALTSYFIGKIFCSLGYYVFNYRDYPSLIRGGHNFNVLRISDKPVYSHKNKYDIILALDQKTIDLHQKDLNKNGFVIGDKTLKAKKLCSIDLKSILSRLKAPKILEADILVGFLFKHFGVNKKILLKAAEKQFREKAKLVKKTIEEGYDLAKTKGKLKKIGPAKYFISGNEAISIGALAAGLDIYIAYPMTPATHVLHFLAKRQLEHNILVLQLENETGIANAAVGASFAGAKVMVGTSGGGFALMTEALSLAGMSELPLVVYLAQRTAPASGVPTYTAQGDLKFALNSGHGEFPRIVVAPGDPQEAIIRAQEAFYLSSRYRTLAILLGDKHLGESNYSFDEIKKSPIGNQRFLLKNPSKNYKGYQITKTGVSPRAVPGQGPFVRATSYEHNEYGNTIEDPDWIVKMNNKRLKKIRHLVRDIKKFNPVTVYGKGKNLIIGWGSTKGAIIDAISELNNFRFLQISYLSPFPKEKVAKEIKKSQKIILVENNATGLLGDVIAEQTGLIIKDKVLKYDARPFTPSDIIRGIKKL